MSKFKVGDRVKVIADVPDKRGLLGRNGTICGGRDDFPEVRFDDNIGGWGVGQRSWGVDANRLELVGEHISIHITCTDNKTTHAVKKVDGKIVARSKAVCCPSDTFDFAVGANLAYDRLMRPETLEKAQSEQPKQEDKPKFKVGDKVRVTKRRCGHRFLIGEIVTLKHDYGDHSWKCSNGRHEWLLVPREFEPYTEPESTEPKQEPVKLYCVKDWGTAFTAGRIYEVSNEKIHFDDGSFGYFPSDFQQAKKTFPNLTSCLVPLVSRPAKVGEWVLITSDLVDGTEKGEICEVLSLNEYGNNKPYLRTKKPTIYGTPEIEPCTLASHDQYLVLDGYKPEPEYLNMKVICAAANGSRWFTAGKVYEVRNGVLNYNGGEFDYNPCNPARTLEQLNVEQVPRFIEFKGE